MRCATLPSWVPKRPAAEAKNIRDANVKSVKNSVNAECAEMTYILATTETKVRWYVVPLRQPRDIEALQPGQFTLLDHLDLSVVPGFGNKYTAKEVAKAIGLKTWRYVKFDGPHRVYVLERVEMGEE